MASPDKDLYVCVAVGGAIGSLLRHALDLAIPTPAGHWPIATFAVNLTGAFLLGVVLVLAQKLAPDPQFNSRTRRLRPFVVTGILGGYTTFSTYMVETHNLVKNDQVGMAGAYLFGSLVAGALLVMIAMALTELVARRVGPLESSSALAAGAFVRREAEDEA